MSETKRDFDTLLMESVREGLTKVLGDNNARCVVFYVDPHMAVADPDNYARSLLGLFGTGTKVVLDTILDNLHEKTGVAKGSATSFGEIVKEARRNFKQSGQIKT
jgi:hypothetical protein